MLLISLFLIIFVLFFFNDTATTEIYTLSLHDALPITPSNWPLARIHWLTASRLASPARSEEHTSELQSHHEIVCRLLLEKKKTIKTHLIDAAERPAGAAMATYVSTC